MQDINNAIIESIFNQFEDFEINLPSRYKLVEGEPQNRWELNIDKYNKKIKNHISKAKLNFYLSDYILKYRNHDSFKDILIVDIMNECNICTSKRHNIEKMGMLINSHLIMNNI